jgi:hypothetical protein
MPVSVSWTADLPLPSGFRLTRSRREASPGCSGRHSRLDGVGPLLHACRLARSAQVSTTGREGSWLKLPGGGCRNPLTAAGPFLRRNRAEPTSRPPSVFPPRSSTSLAPWRLPPLRATAYPAAALRNSDMSRCAAIWLSFAVVLLHNLDEHLTMGGSLAAHRSDLPSVLAWMTGERAEDDFLQHGGRRAEHTWAEVAEFSGVSVRRAGPLSGGYALSTLGFRRERSCRSPSICMGSCESATSSKR